MNHIAICANKTATQLRVITPQLILCNHILNKNKKGTNSQKWDSSVSLTEHKEDGSIAKQASREETKCLDKTKAYYTLNATFQSS